MRHWHMAIRIPRSRSYQCCIVAAAVECSDMAMAGKTQCPYRLYCTSCKPHRNIDYQMATTAFELIFGCHMAMHYIHLHLDHRFWHDVNSILARRKWFWHDVCDSGTTGLLEQRLRRSKSDYFEQPQSEVPATAGRKRKLKWIQKHAPCLLSLRAP